MTTDHLTRALQACAAGMLPLEAGVTLLTGHRTFLHRDFINPRELHLMREVCPV
jgi:hypothetical protein